MRVLGLAALVSLLLCSASLRVQGQSWKELANKAKKKAQDKPTTSTSSTNPASSNETWFAFCSVIVGGSPTTAGNYHSQVFPYDHSQTGALFSQVLPAWKEYATSKLKVMSASADKSASCVGDTGPVSRNGDQMMIKRRNDTVAAERRYFEGGNWASKPYETDWTYNGAKAVSSSSPDAAPAVSANSSTAAPSQAPVAPEPVTTGSIVYTYCFLSLRDPHKTYLSDVFQIHKQDRNTLYATYPPRFAQFVADKYQVMTVGRGHVGGFGCEDGFDTEARASARRAADLTRYQNNRQMDGAVEVPWKGETSEARH